MPRVSHSGAAGGGRQGASYDFLPPPIKTDTPNGKYIKVNIQVCELLQVQTKEAIENPLKNQCSRDSKTQ